LKQKTTQIGKVKIVLTKIKKKKIENKKYNKKVKQHCKW